MSNRMVSSLKNMQNPGNISNLSQREAAETDKILMGPLSFSVDQLMVGCPVALWFCIVFVNYFKKQVQNEKGKVVIPNYVLIYEDNEGDRMLVSNVPWKFLEEH
ncbi:uncharacterized protein LOC131221240 [Magnolia sinica]|uniref:uncharacterized protein LOC131221240 n=1 Tax=Magnolia sinica TaxID=86752 RepID=UPI002658EABA|nr:uncharacterized protein LOC131221240 [Magnolia sinica]